MITKYKTKLFFRVSMFLGLIIFLAGCAATQTVKSEQQRDVADTAKIKVAQPGDLAEIGFKCRLKNGEILAAIDALEGTDPKSKIFVARKEPGPVTIAVLESDKPLPESPEAFPFFEEILEHLMRQVAGMKEGETRRMEIAAKMIPPKNEQSGFAYLSRVRTRRKEMTMPIGDYIYRAHKTPEVGQAYAYDPSFPGRVVSFNDKEVFLRFSATPGSVIETPFGNGRIREEGDQYKVDIDAQAGGLVRTGNKIGRISKVDDKMIVIDYRHPFGYEALTCDVIVNKIKDAAAKDDGVKK